MLEQRLEAYISKQPTQEGQRVYTVVDLEHLSASALYTGEPCGGIGLPVPRLTIRPIGPNTQLHIHEGIGGTAHIKTRRGEYQNISSFDAAILDAALEALGVKQHKK